jgi:hypothetical protein
VGCLSLFVRKEGIVTGIDSEAKFGRKSFRSVGDLIGFRACWSSSCLLLVLTQCCENHPRAYIQLSRGCLIFLSTPFLDALWLCRLYIIVVGDLYLDGRPCFRFVPT